MKVPMDEAGKNDAPKDAAPDAYLSIRQTRLTHP